MTTVTHGTGFGCDSNGYNHDVQHEDDKVTGDIKITDLGRVQFNTMHSLHFRRVFTMDFTFSFFRSV